MEPLAVINQHHIDPERDRPRNRSMVKMRVRNRRTRALQVLENTISIGEHEISVYENEVEKVMAMVETEPHLLKDAERLYELELAQAFQEMVSDNGTPETMLTRIKSGSLNEDESKLYRRLLKITPLSVEGMF